MEETAGLDIGRTDEYTVATWLHTWFALYAKPNIRLATQNRYELMMDIYAIPRIGAKLTAHDLQLLYRDLQENGRVRPTKKGGGKRRCPKWTPSLLILMGLKPGLN